MSSLVGAKTEELDPSEDPSTQSIAYQEMSSKWGMIGALLGGTCAMRDAGQEYLPQHEQESDDNYSERLHGNVLFNMFELTIEQLVGKPFSDPIRLGDDVPESIGNLMDDVDLKGNTLTSFCRNWFYQSLAKSFCHVVVDMPPLPAIAEDAPPRTLADDNAENRRPYWTLVKPEDVIFASAEIINGEEVLTHVRIKENVIQRNGFAEEVSNRIRVLEPGHYEIWELQVDPNDPKSSTWVKIQEGDVGLNVIPMVTFYANRGGLMCGKPPLEDLAYLNIRHWQSNSDQINILTVARFPMLAVAGATDQTGSEMAIGPRQMLGTKDPNGRFYYVEHTGAAIKSGAEDLTDLEQKMAAYGAQFLRKMPGGQTALARALDTAEAMSPLQDMSQRFVNAINCAMTLTAEWLGQASGGHVEMTTDFGPTEVDQATLQALIAARKNGDLSREDFLARLVQLGLLSFEFDPKVNLIRLQYEMSELGIPIDMLDPDDILKLPPAPPPAAVKAGLPEGDDPTVVLSDQQKPAGAGGE